MSESRPIAYPRARRALALALLLRRRRRAAAAQAARPRRRRRRPMPTSPTSPMPPRWSRCVAGARPGRGRARARARPRARATRGSISRRAPRRCSPAARRSANRCVYLADVPLDAKGKAPKLKKQRFLRLRRPGRRAARATLQLVGPTAQLPGDAGDRAAARATVIAELAAPDAPPRGDRGARRACRSRQPRRRIGNPAVPRHRDRRAGLAHRGPPPGHGRRVGRVVFARSSTRRRARRSARRWRGTASPASCRAQLPARRQSCSRTAPRARAGRGRLRASSSSSSAPARARRALTTS